jgi:VWFA-related protein
MKLKLGCGCVLIMALPMAMAQLAPPRPSGTTMPTTRGLPGKDQSPATRSGASSRQQTTTIRTRTELVTVPVVVTRGGKHVSGLEKKDFTILEDGQPKSVAFFEEVKTVEQRIQPAPAEPGVHTNAVAPGAAGLMTPAVVLLDTLNTPYLEQANGRQEIVKFLAKSVTPDHPTMLVVLHRNGLKVLHDFSTSPEALVAALKRVSSSLEGHQMSSKDVADENALRQTDAGLTVGDTSIGAGIDPTTASVISDMLTDFIGNTEATPPSAVAMQGCARAETTLDALQQLSRAFGAIVGRKTLLWATGGNVPLPLDAGRGACPNLGEQFDSTWNLLSSANIAVYPIDLAQQDNPTYVDVGINDPTYRLSRPMTKQFIFDSFAAYTGGTVCSFRNDLDSCFKKAVDDSSQYYLLSYYARPVEKSTWRKLHVKVNGDGLHVRARTGFFSLGAEAGEDEKRKMDVALAVVSPVEYTGVPMTVRWTDAGKPGSAGKKKYGFEVKVAPHALTIDDVDDNHLKLDVIALAQNSAWETISDATQTVEAHLKPEHAQQVQNSGFRYTGTLELPPGTWTVRFMVRDALSGRMGTVRAAITAQ